VKAQSKLPPPLQFSTDADGRFLHASVQPHPRRVGRLCYRAREGLDLDIETRLAAWERASEEANKTR